MSDRPITRKPVSQPRVVHGLVVALLLALILLLSYAYHVGMWRYIIRFYKHFFEVRRLEAFILSYGAYAKLMFVALQALQVVFAPIPGEVTGFVGGFLYGTVAGSLLSTIGLTAGSLMAFFIARLLGLPLVEKVVKKRYRDEFDQWVTHRGLYIVFILFLIPGFPKDSLCYLLGLTHLGVTAFILMNIFGRLPGTVLLALQGSAVDKGHYATFFILLGCSLLMMAILYLTRHHCTDALHEFARRMAGRTKSPPTMGTAGQKGGAERKSKG
jgi:uncharacterized membrane protein YdjX (TVP38/TMEM64 family)